MSAHAKPFLNPPVVPPTFRRKPLEFKALLWSDLPGVHECLAEWAKASGQLTRYDQFSGIMYITTREGSVGCKPGDWFVRDDEGEVYPVLDRRFRRLYELVPESIQVGDKVLVKGMAGHVHAFEEQMLLIEMGDGEIRYAHPTDVLPCVG